MKIQNKLFTATTPLAAMLASMPLQAVEKGDILARVRIINIAPNVGSNDLKDTAGASMGAGIDVESAATLDIDFTYMVTNNIGVELLLDITSTHDITGTGGLSGVGVGDVMVLPPALIAQWHFMPTNNIRPYAGAGINYTMFFNENTTAQLDTVLGGQTSLSVDDAFGLVAQVGVDIDINKSWYVNFDAKYIDLNTTAAVSVNGSKAATVDFDLNPLVLGVGIGTSF
ncbi:MAG: outer membrane beta-barrel protein [Gammaproteobacteria bacterium]|nr:MAG: outer membrane beta-barrel protein [Gammaproteobacteria bacterium]